MLVKRKESNMDKEIRIFDTSNNVLKVKGIRFELHDVGYGTVLDVQNSDDLNPASGGSNEWGVKLTFSPSAGPLDVYTTDPNHQYPGNTIRNLEGKNDNRVDIDLLKVPATAGGQGGPLTVTDPAAVTAWVQSAPKWADNEKLAVLNFIFNYVRLLAQRDFVKGKGELERLAKDWEMELKRLGVQLPPPTK
jgi:hypothetical protein